ncbi:methyl-accepting chemotaxis protein [Paenibacillus tarimensis]|uniref:methyl-accepting chemotaxis protein n=1 Tax=Paenibacillus tarimensis TaxID=416012 RepID=UPI001F184921|nr:methyl-accepting chemotaxis protein [Paenibacillus tarimensis]MCF2943134.1 methyl-accepting chemotaxis protein [Paenibacillus tarimensis]
MGTKLRIGFFIMLMLIGTVGAASNTSMKNMQQQAETIESVYLPAMKILADTRVDLMLIQQLGLEVALASDGAEIEELETAIQQAIEDMQALDEAFYTIAGEGEQKALYMEFDSYRQQVAAIFPSLLEAGKQGELEAAGAAVKAMQEPYSGALGKLEQLIELNEQEGEKAADASVEASGKGQDIVNLVTLLGIVSGGVISWAIARMIAGPLASMAAAAAQISAGDLTGDAIQVKNRDEIGELAGSFNTMARNLRGLIREVWMGTELVAASSQELNAGTEQTRDAADQIMRIMDAVAEGALQQTERIAESVSAFEELSQGARHIAENAERVSQAAAFATEYAEDGNRTVVMSIRQMQAINDTVTGLAEAVQRLDGRSLEIGLIVEAISKIAAQTNLLALNASIEAARVGEQGKGFAVVAHEVRQLAEQSKESAGQIAELVQAIRQETTRTVSLMNAGTKEVDEGILAVNAAGAAFEQIRCSIDAVARQIQEVTAASRQMSASTEQAASSVYVISQITDTASAGTQQVATALEEQLASMDEMNQAAALLSAKSGELQHLIGKFSV